MIKVEFADLIIGINTDDEDLKKFFKDYLCDKECDFVIDLTDEDINYEINYYNNHDISYRVSDFYFRVLALQRKISNELYKYNALLFHGSALAKNNEGILFSGVSGAGKSTHARIYRETFDDVIMINDDKPFIRVFDDEIKIYGSPWDGKHHLSKNISYPLKKICFINQSKNNNVEKMNKDDILPKLFSQTYRPNSKEGLAKTMLLLDKIIHNVSVYNIYCNMEKDAAIVSYNGIKNE